MDETSKRNFGVINEEIKRRQVDSSELHSKINHLEEVIAQLESRINAMQGQVNMLIAKTMGGGPTA